MAEKLATVAVIGLGGAEAALVKKYSESPHVGKIIAIPGNDMMREVTHKPVELLKNVAITDDVEIGILCKDKDVDLVDIRNERALQAGLAGQLRLHRIPAVGPTSSASKLEWSKEYAREVGEYIGLPQPKYTSISFKYLNYGQTVPDYYYKTLDKFKDGDYFVKANGLMDGKGVIHAQNKSEIDEAIGRLRDMDKKAAETVVIESALQGEEFSAFAISDSRNYRILGYAQDHKRAFDEDSGPNTGGMGAVSHPIISESKTLQQGVTSIFDKVFDQKHGLDPYRGILYLGGMAADSVVGLVPSVVEFNCRWGDPEAQVIIPGLNVDFFEMGMETAKGTLRRVNISDDGLTRIAVAISTNESFDAKRKTEIKSVKELKGLENVNLYGARVMIEDEKYWIGGVGRILHIGGVGKNIIEARAAIEPALEILRQMDGDNLYARSDIGWRDVQRLQNGV